MHGYSLNLLNLTSLLEMIKLQMKIFVFYINHEVVTELG